MGQVTHSLLFLLPFLSAGCEVCPETSSNDDPYFPVPKVRAHECCAEMASKASTQGVVVCMTLHSKLPADVKGAKLGQCKQKGLGFLS